MCDQFSLGLFGVFGGRGQPAKLQPVFDVAFGVKPIEKSVHASHVAIHGGRFQMTGKIPNPGFDRAPEIVINVQGPDEGLKRPVRLLVPDKSIG